MARKTMTKEEKIQRSIAEAAIGKVALELAEKVRAEAANHNNDVDIVEMVAELLRTPRTRTSTKAKGEKAAK